MLEMIYSGRKKVITLPLSNKERQDKREEEWLSEHTNRHSGTTKITIFIHSLF